MHLSRGASDVRRDCMSLPGALGMPSPLVAFLWGSMSMIRTSLSYTARLAPRLITVVVFPTPPF
jgi:hypothetical protein